MRSVYIKMSARLTPPTLWELVALNSVVIYTYLGDWVASQYSSITNVEGFSLVGQDSDPYALRDLVNGRCVQLLVVYAIASNERSFVSPW